MPLATTTAEERRQKEAAIDWIDETPWHLPSQREPHLRQLLAYPFIYASDLEDLAALKQALQTWLKENPPSS
jgi:hypothetical protein